MFDANGKVMPYRSTRLRNMSRIMTHDLEFAIVTFSLGTLQTIPYGKTFEIHFDHRI